MVILGAQCSGTPPTVIDYRLSNISVFLLWSPSKSLRTSEQEEGIGLATPHNVVRHTLQLFPYKLRAVQQLQSVDNEKRIRYYEWFNTFIHTKSVDILNVKVLLLQLTPGSASLTLLIHKIHVCGHRTILMLCMKRPCATRNLERGLQYPDDALLVLYSLKRRRIVNAIVHYSTI